MNFPEVHLKIIEDNECPLYSEDDEFKIFGTAMVHPAEKPVCLILIDDFTRKFRGGAKEAPKDTFYCSGCVGRIRLEYRIDLFTRTPMPGKKKNDRAAIIDKLKKFEIFEPLEKTDIEHIITFLKLKRFGENDIVIRKGEPGRYLFIIVSGRVEVLEENNVCIAALGPGEVFGEMSLLSGNPVGATIRVVEPARILFIGRRDFKQILNKFPSFQMYFSRLLVKRLSFTNIARAEEFSSGMTGGLSEMLPAEIFQSLNSNQKTGMIDMDLSRGNAKVFFRDGEIVHASYDDLKGKDAFFEILKEKEGRFKFKPQLPDEHEIDEPLGDFMWLLMEGVRVTDEAE
jgi:CRP/FNR family cyclic AMP-dependent transcriptional regulator